MIPGWLSDKNTREVLTMLGGAVTVIAGGGWAVFLWATKEEPKPASSSPTMSVQATYTVCRSNLAKECPKNAVWISCGESIADWAKRECSKYEMAATTGTGPIASKNCGPVTISLTCYGAKKSLQ